MRQLKITQSITSRDSQSFDTYLQEIGKIDLVIVAEEVELAQKIRAGDQKALEKLVKANLRFVVSIAKHYQWHWILLPDLVNEGNLWLIKAAKRFDETRGFKFISYAVWRIRQGILQAIKEHANTVKLPMNKLQQFNKLHYVNSSLKQTLQRSPTAEEIAQVLWWTAIDVVGILNWSKKASLDTPIGDYDEEYTLMNILSQEDQEHTDHTLAYTDSLRQEIARSLSLLTSRESQILKMSFGIGRKPCSVETIWEEFGISDTMVRNIKERAIRRLRSTNKSKNLKEFLW